MDSVVCAVVVTHNRREMLRRCLSAVAEQQRPPDRVMVVDNASTDGTREMVERDHPGVEVISMPINEGGAGGFHEGIRRAHDDGAEWIWLLDDDTIATPGALGELLAAAAIALDGLPAPTMLASKVLWRDGSLHPMNFPTLERARLERVIAGAQRGVMPLRAATFTSLLVHRGVVDRHHLPLKSFFLWSDDIEYTSRAVLGGELAYFVPISVVLHDTATAEDFRSAAPPRFYYHARNTLLMARGPGRPWSDRLLRLWIFASTSAAYVFRNRTADSLTAVLRALRDGLRVLP